VTRPRPCLWAASAPAATATLTPALADAGGMVLHSRGVRPTARGGAFVAGADDLGAMWFNPAGLGHAAAGDTKTAILLDATYVGQSAEYTRVDSGMNPQETVSNEAPGLPVPSIAAGFDLGEQGVLAFGIYAPYAGLMKFQPDGPARYSLVDLSKSLIVTAAVGVSWNLGDRIRIGATFQNWMTSLVQQVVVSGCPGQTLCAPEDPEMDVLVEITQRDLFNPSGSAGIQIDAHDRVTLGAAVQLPIKLSGGAKLATRLPSSGFYDGAAVVGEDADVSFTLPATVRVGLEASPADRWKLELALDYELWSMHDEMRIVPDDMRIEGQAGVGTYELGPMSVPRNFEDSIAASVGVEGQPSSGVPLRVLAGFTYETAAAPDAYLSPLTFDGNKLFGALGLGYTAGKYAFDALVGYVKVSDRTVTPEEGVSPQLTPVRDPSAEPLTTYVNWGDYKTSWLLVGAGMRASF
jgi:long-chain fatty acid transport protein